MTDDNPIILADSVTDRIRSLFDNRGFESDRAGLRISVEPGGCAGLMYRFELAASPETGDIVCEHEGISIFVDSASEPYLKGSHLEFEDTAHGTGFTIDNPNAAEQCGCGISFLRQAPETEPTEGPP